MYLFATSHVVLSLRVLSPRRRTVDKILDSSSDRFTRSLIVTPSSACVRYIGDCVATRGVLDMVERDSKPELLVRKYWVLLSAYETQ